MQFHTTLKNSKLSMFGAALALIVAASATYGQESGDDLAAAMRGPVIKPAIEGIFDAFATHALVGIAEKHNQAELLDFYKDIIRDPRFARDVGNVVVEFGGAARQDVIDRYVNGEIVPYTELRRVWTDTVGWQPTVTGLGYAQFFAQVREVNLTLPPEQRIRVWLGEPPIDWSKIETSEEWWRLLSARDSHAAEVIDRHILKPDSKALVIYGGGHFRRATEEETSLYLDWAALDPEGPKAGLNVQMLIEHEHPNAFFLVHVYVGFFDEPCTARFERDMGHWTMPALAVPVRGTTLERELRECLPKSELTPFLETAPQALRDFLAAKPNGPLLLDADGLLFLGPAASLTESPIFPDLYLDEEYRQEIIRHMTIVNGTRQTPEFGRDYAVTPRKLMQRDGQPLWIERPKD